jgi:hypothetical protein
MTDPNLIQSPKEKERVLIGGTIRRLIRLTEQSLKDEYEHAQG